MDARQKRVPEIGVKPELPSEIMEEILSKLPVKSLVRFRCVSRTWQSLISQPRFIRKHLAHASQPDNLDSKKLIIAYPSLDYFYDSRDLFWSPVSSVTDRHLNDIENRLVCPFEGKILFLGCCDGMLCVSSMHGVFLWNPAIKTRRKLPPSENQLIRLATIRRVVYGFGYDSMNNDYKVFQLAGFSDGSIETRLYSLNNNSWRKIGEPPRDLAFCSSTADGVFVNGAIHWLLRQRGSLHAIILSYDLSDNKCKELPLPECSPFSMILVLELAVSGDMLCLLTGHVNHSFVFWMMKDYGIKESWTKIFTISSNVYDIKPLYSSDGGAVMIMSPSKWNGRLLAKCKKDGTILCEELRPRLFGHGEQEVVCVESLISPWQY